MDNKYKYNSYKSIYLFMKQFGGAIQNCEFITHLELMHGKPLSGKDINDQYELLKKIRLIYQNNTILFMYSDADNPKYQPILWSKLKEAFQNSKFGIDISIMKAIGALRKMTIDHFLKRDYEKDSVEIDPFDDRCYTEIGSTDATSDLDFTYVDLMIKFYNELYKVYLNFPNDTFDTNYYVSSAFISNDCYLQIKRTIRDLFIDYGHRKQYRRYYFKSENETYQNLDRNICFSIQANYLKQLDDHDHTANKMDNLIRASVIFYNTLAKHNDKLDNNKFMILTRTLYYLMTCNSNESYISDTTFNIIV
jgi:hypothetical protein